MKHVTPLLLAVCLFGCTPKDFSVQVSNLGGVEIDDVHVAFEGFQSGFGVMPPHKRATHAFVLAPFPTTVSVSWRAAGASRTARLACDARRTQPAYLHVVFGSSGEPVIKTSAVDLSPDCALPQYRAFRALTAAVEANDAKAAKSLIIAGAPLEWEDPTTLSPLEYAAIRGNTDILSSLLAHGAQSVSPYRAGWAVKCAAQNDDVAALTLLVAVWPPASLPPSSQADAMYSAVSHGRGAGLRFLVSHGLNINLVLTPGGHTALDVAVMEGKGAIEHWLHENGALSGPSGRASRVPSSSGA